METTTKPRSRFRIVAHNDNRYAFVRRNIEQDRDAGCNQLTLDEVRQLHADTATILNCRASAGCFCYEQGYIDGEEAPRKGGN